MLWKIQPINMVVWDAVDISWAQCRSRWRTGNGNALKEAVRDASPKNPRWKVNFSLNLIFIASWTCISKLFLSHKIVLIVQSDQLLSFNYSLLWIIDCRNISKNIRKIFHLSHVSAPLCKSSLNPKKLLLEAPVAWEEPNSVSHSAKTAFQSKLRPALERDSRIMNLFLNEFSLRLGF